VGRCRVRRPWLFWGELGVLAFCPQTSIAPTDPFSQENAPDLGAAHHDTTITRSSRQCIQRPVRLPLLIEGFELSTTAAYQTPWRLCSGQSDDPRAFQLREAWLASGSGAISESIYPFGVEAMEGGECARSWGGSQAPQLSWWCAAPASSKRRSGLGISSLRERGGCRQACGSSPLLRHLRVGGRAAVSA
jgi:hypothetical protein